MRNVYVDHAATSPTHPDVVKTMEPYFTNYFGNPSSIHSFGRKTRQALDESRRTIAKSLNANYKEIVFTSGGTEADNLALIGYANANKDKGKHIITTQIEHHAILHTCEYLEKEGFEVTYLPVDETGRISVKQVEDAIQENTILVSVMFENNEVGTVQPIREIGHFLKEYDIAFHTDAVQAYGLINIDVKELGIDLLSISGHKINGPKGIGALYVKEELSIYPYSHGGEQERKRRAGTEFVPGIIGLAKAVEAMTEEKETKYSLLEQLRSRMLDRLTEAGISYSLNGSREHYLPNILNISFHGTKAEAMLVNLDLSGIAASSGSACTAGSLTLSHVLSAMFDSEVRNQSAIRFSFGYGNSIEDIDYIVTELTKIIERIKE